MADHTLVGHHERETTIDDHFRVDGLAQVADLGDAKLKGRRSGDKARLAHHFHGKGIEHVQPKVAAHAHADRFCQHRVAEISDQGLVDAEIKKLLQRLAHNGLLIVGDDARQHHHRGGAVLLKGFEQVKVFAHHRHGDIEIPGLERRKLGGELFGI